MAIAAFILMIPNWMLVISSLPIAAFSSEHGIRVPRSAAGFRLHRFVSLSILATGPGLRPALIRFPPRGIAPAHLGDLDFISGPGDLEC
jgi:hypothetical protein